MTFLPADYVLAAFALTMAVTGIFRGFSGTLAFVLATAAAGGAAAFGWMYLAQYVASVWMRAGATLVLGLVVFGLVRVVVKKSVNGLLAQPADAIFGFLFGAAVGVGVPALWAWSGMFVEYSGVASFMANILGRGV